MENNFDFSNLDENREIFSNKNKKVIGIFKIETPKNNWIDEFISLRSKVYAFKCGIDSKNIIKSFSKSQSKHIEIEEYYICLFDGEYHKEFNKSIIRSINHEMYLRTVKKSTLSQFDDKRKYIFETESIPWN